MAEKRPGREPVMAAVTRKRMALLSPLTHIFLKEYSDIVLASVAKDGTLLAYTAAPLEVAITLSSWP